MKMKGKNLVYWPYFMGDFYVAACCDLLAKNYVNLIIWKIFDLKNTKNLVTFKNFNTKTEI